MICLLIFCEERENRITIFLLNLIYRVIVNYIGIFQKYFKNISKILNLYYKMQKIYTKCCKNVII